MSTGQGRISREGPFSRPVFPARAAPGTHAEHAAIRLSAAGLRQDTILVCLTPRPSDTAHCARLVTRSLVRYGRRPSHLGAASICSFPAPCRTADKALIAVTKNPPRVPTTALQVESITSLRWGACLFDTRMPWLCLGAAVCTSPRAWGMPVGSPGPRDLLRTLRARASRPQNRHTALRETSRCGFLGVS